MSRISFEVCGVPVPQGSKSYFVDGKGRPRGREANKAHASWRNDVSVAARQAALDARLEAPLDGPLQLTIIFRFPMPKSRRKADRERGWRTKDTAPDTDKLVRCVADSLKAAAVISDDARVAALNAYKVEVFGEWTGAAIFVTELPCDWVP